MNGNIVIVVTNRQGKVVASRVFHRSSYSSPDNYEGAIAKQIGSYEHKYGTPSYAIHQGSASTVTSFLTVYPELTRK